MGTLRSAMIYSNLIPKSYLSFNIYGNDQLINQSINQSVNHAINQPTNQPTNQGDILFLDFSIKVAAKLCLPSGLPTTFVPQQHSTRVWSIYGKQ